MDAEGNPVMFGVDLRQLTLTNLYNEPPTWLHNAHSALDKAVAAAYGWDADISDEEVLERLLGLNLERAEGQGQSEQAVAGGVCSTSESRDVYMRR